MFTQEQISVVIESQRTGFQAKEGLLKREALPHVPIVDSFATIITGIRRCGKSTLLLEILKEKYTDALYLNFEDIRLVGFETSDFVRVQKEADNRNLRVLYLDEIQLVENWEIFVHQLLREGYAVFITGSNALLLSKELGTHLTGRHLSMELFPFSYSEFIAFNNLLNDEKSLVDYLQIGGLPEYVKSRNKLVIQKLVEDILVRDIAIRHSIRDVDSLKQLAIYLLSNIGVPVSANKLNGLFGIKSNATILEYFAFFKDAYLIEILPQFSYSLKAQARNAKKIYAIDTGLIGAVSTSFSDNLGRKLENLVYLHLRRRSKEIYFFKENSECDFILFQNGKAIDAIQVCYQLDDMNLKREYQGLLEALGFFKITKGTIVTLNQEDEFIEDGIQIDVIPAYRYFSRTEPV